MVHYKPMIDRGFVIMAQGDIYVKCAKALEANIKCVMPHMSTTIVTTDMLPYKDQVPDIEWKLQNDWQVYEASPYEHTIKLEADMFIPNDISHWFDTLRDRDVVVSTAIRNYKQELSDVKFYRRFVVDNDLPDTYNALTYFKKSPTAEKFYKIVRDIFENWDDYTPMLKCSPNEKATTDFVYAIACHILGVENTTLPTFTGMSMVHMKQHINELPTENWTDTLIPELLPHTFRINTVPQRYPVHYHIKEFADRILEFYNG